MTCYMFQNAINVLYIVEEFVLFEKRRGLLKSFEPVRPIDCEIQVY